jgi:soluble lytic murein transglycosylase
LPIVAAPRLGGLLFVDRRGNRIAQPVPIDEMRRLNATLLLFVFTVSVVAPALVSVPLAAKTRSMKSRITKAPAPKARHAGARLPKPAPHPGQVKTVEVPNPDPNPNRVAIPMQGARPPLMDFVSVLNPLLEYALSAGDEVNLKTAISASNEGDARGALAAMARINDDAARKLATWYIYRSVGGSAELIESFRAANPDWPALGELRARAEATLFLKDAAEQTKAFFATSPPMTGAGKAALASALMKEGNDAAAKPLVASAWRDHNLSESVEKKILDRFGTMLTSEDHHARIDRLLYKDDPGVANTALRVAKLLSSDEQQKVNARIAILKRDDDAGSLFDALPESTTAGDVGLLFNRIQWLRRNHRDQEAWKLLLSAPNDPDKLLDVENWWIERRLNCRAALNAGQSRIAYEIAVKHGLISGDAYVEAEFLAGWIALRFLNEPNYALGHFLVARIKAKSSKSIALTEYWLGRTRAALGDSGSAANNFRVAALYPQYFYGQLARQVFDEQPTLVLPSEAPSPTDIQRFLANDAVRAIAVARAVELDQVTSQFFLALARQLKNPGEIVLLAELAKTTGKPKIALTLAKIAFNRDMPVGEYALPLGVLPEFKTLLDEHVDPALVHALSRQESEFKAEAKSPVGATGLMQLMPPTARVVAKQYDVKYDAAQLTKPVYNIQLGEAFLGDLIHSYSGSYLLALAAYNAGGGRVQDWTKQFGDPRNPDVDPIDWIERIPFTETRNYVKKIMETLQLYRSRLAGGVPLQLVQDLNRGRASKPSVPTAKDVQARSD